MPTDGRTTLIPGSSPSERPPGRSTDTFVKIGDGEIGGKAKGLIDHQGILRDRLDAKASGNFQVDIPWFWAVATDWFDQFMENNHLHEIALSDTRDPHLANAFQKAELPRELVEALRDLIRETHAPLAVRSSSVLEDALQEPFAGVYSTKMLPNNQFSTEARLRVLTEAIKFVYASTFFRDAKSYRKAMGRSDKEEKMAVMIQEVLGLRHGDRFYPTLSGVARSYNFYSLGHARPENGVVSLALGLGKTIVEGGRTWTYCPAHPRAKPPFGSPKELLEGTQTRFWSVNMGKPPSYDPIQETEYLCEGDLGHAEKDGVLTHLASTYDPQADRIILGTGNPGPRALTFGPLLELDGAPLNELIRNLMTICEEALDNPVEIEFAVNLNGGAGGRARFGFLQVRPMCVSDERVEVRPEELQGDRVLMASEEVLGNGQVDTIKDIVYVKPDVFTSRDSWAVVAELEEMNRRLLDASRPYLLVAIGRLGTSDPFLGIPVRWGQVSGARAVVEAIAPGMNVDMSQGSHFFHNVTCLRILYFSADRTGKHPINWDWLVRQKSAGESQFIRHVALDEPLRIKVDGGSGRGVILHGRADSVGD